MIGYASSADESGSCDSIIVTVIFADDFALEDYGAGREVYRVSRSFKHASKISPPGDRSYNIPFNAIIGIATMLHVEELKFCCACRIAWKYSEIAGVEVIKTSFLEDVWLPLPMINEGCSADCINITSQLFPEVPKPLETSMVCDMMNILFLQSGITVAGPFYNCFNSVFCNADIAKPLMLLLGDSFPFSDEKLNFSEKLQTKGSKVKFTEAKVLQALSDYKIPKSVFEGNALSFAVGAKRECLRKLVGSFDGCIKRKSGWHAFWSLASAHINEFQERLLSLAQIFVIAENVNYISDISYLTLYELHSALAFYETRLTLKTDVRHSRQRQHILNSLKVPDIIYYNKL